MKKYLSLLLALVMVATMAVSFSGCGTKKTNLADYLTISVSGYDKAGRADFRIDEDALGEDSGLNEAIHQDLMDDSSVYSLYGFGDYSGSNALVKAYLKIVDYRFEFVESDALSNGETVTLKVTCDENAKERLAKDLKVDITSPAEITYTIGKEELPKADTIDPFKRLKIKFSGFDGMSEVKFVTDETVETIGKLTVTGDDAEDSLVVKKGDAKSSFRYYISKVNGEPFEGYRSGIVAFPQNLKNGDNVTVSVQEPYTNKGYVYTSTSKEYKVKGLTSFLTDSTKITDAMIEKVRKEAVKTDASMTFHGYEFNTILSIVFQVKKDANAEYENRLLIRCQDITKNGPYKGTRRYLNGVAGNVYIQDGTLEVKNMEHASDYYDDMPVSSDPTGEKAFQKMVDDDSYTSYVLK